MSKNGQPTYQNHQGTGTGDLRKVLIALYTYTKREKIQINDLNFGLQENRRTKANEIQTEEKLIKTKLKSMKQNTKMIEKINETESLFFGKINAVNISTLRLVKKIRYRLLNWE